MAVVDSIYSYPVKNYPELAEKYPTITGDDGGIQFQQLFQHLPFLAPFYTKFEAEYQVAPGYLFVSNHWEVPIGCIAVYLLWVYFGPKYMDKIEYKNIWDTRGLLACWNALLCVFSFAGALRTVPHLLYLITTRTFEETICTPPVHPQHGWGLGATGMWVQLFILSKIPELFDTFFIVQRKRPLIFLHWYHHVTVLLYCWHSYATEASQALYFVAMNYSVHATMYGYYCLKALKIQPPIPDYCITFCQIAQMVVGFGVQCASLMYHLADTNGTCGVKHENMIAGAAMFASYFALFVAFAVKRFIMKPKAKKI